MLPSPSEQIQAAIVKLEHMRDAAMKGPWRGCELNFWGTPTPGVWADGEEDSVGYPLNQPDADLLVTLHATIDAQLAILNLAAANYWEPGTAPDDWESFAESWKVLYLARAILGEEAT